MRPCWSNWEHYCLASKRSEGDIPGWDAFVGLMSSLSLKEGEWRTVHSSKEVKDGGIVNDFLDRTLRTFMRYDSMEMVFLKVYTNVVYLYKVRTFVCSKL